MFNPETTENDSEEKNDLLSQDATKMTKINVCDHVNTQILLVYIQHHTNATNHMLELVNKS